MLERLAEALGPYDAQADVELDALFCPEVGPSDYILFLIRAYGFEASLESAFAMTPNLALAVDLRGRARAGLIAEDLMRLGLRPVEVAELPQCLAIPVFRGIAEALGWLYVVERASLVHGVVHEQLRTRIPAEIARASAYLTASDGWLVRRWGELGRVLDEVGRHPAIADRVVQAACEAFPCRHAWMCQDPSRPRTRAVG